MNHQQWHMPCLASDSDIYVSHLRRHVCETSSESSAQRILIDRCPDRCLRSSPTSSQSQGTVILICIYAVLLHSYSNISIGISRHTYALGLEDLHAPHRTTDRQATDRELTAILALHASLTRRSCALLIEPKQYGHGPH